MISNYDSMTLIVFSIQPCQDDHTLTKLCSRTSTTWAFEVPIPAFKVMSSIVAFLDGIA